jgi:3-oxoacyl-[acyl-carrier protein] reductase
MALISLITGGSRGIGQALARRLLARGHRVAITGTTQSGVARAEQALAEECGDAGRVLGLTCDVRDSGSVERAVRTVVARFEGLDVLVNNAGVGVGQPLPTCRSTSGSGSSARISRACITAAGRPSRT